MKPGDYVECVNKYDTIFLPEGISPSIALGERLTVRGIKQFTHGVGITFEEKINPIQLKSGDEYHYRIEDFRKLEVPPLIEKEIEEALQQELVLLVD